MRKEAPENDDGSGLLDRIELVQGLIEATEAHYDWIWAINRALLCRTPIDESQLSHSCAFTRWYQEAIRHPLLRNHPDFRALGDDHAAMHRLVTSLARGQHEVDAAEYDRFLSVREAFKERSRRLEHELWNEACHADALTGLRNRHGMYAELREEQQRAIRECHPSVVALMDTDHFKSINDHYGHLTGDAVLKELTRTVTDHLRPYDRIYRYGGEEFLICLPDTELGQARKIIDRLRLQIAARPFSALGNTITVTVSFGLTLLATDRPVENSIEEADRALYQAKIEGRNRVMMHPGMATGWAATPAS